MERPVGELEIRPGLPARLLGAVIPLAAISLILVGSSGGGLASGADDPAPPAAVAVATLLVAVGLSYRALTQRAVLGPTHLLCRNLAVTFSVEWERVEQLSVLRRPGLTIIEVRVSDLRRRHRLGAATRFAGVDAETLLATVATHPAASAVLVDDGP